jgi:hypothetical protein
MIDGIASAGATFIPPGNDASASRRSENAAAASAERAEARAQPGADVQLSEAEQRRVRELQRRDREVRAHEMAHVVAGGDLILRGANFEYETGPDGRRYAVGGDVLIDTSPGRTPEETIDKAARIQTAALAPADPSAQDRAVAAQAAQMAQQARIELARQEREKREEQDAGETSGGESSSEAVDRIDATVRSAYAATVPGMSPGDTISVFV